jgi:hypothetical protein
VRIVWSSSRSAIQTVEASQGVFEYEFEDEDAFEYEDEFEFDVVTAALSPPAALPA